MGSGRHAFSLWGARSCSSEHWPVRLRDDLIRETFENSQPHDCGLTAAGCAPVVVCSYRVPSSLEKPLLAVCEFACGSHPLGAQSECGQHALVFASRAEKEPSGLLYEGTSTGCSWSAGGAAVLTDASCGCAAGLACGCSCLHAGVQRSDPAAEEESRSLPRHPGIAFPHVNYGTSGPCSDVPSFADSAPARPQLTPLQVREAVLRSCSCGKDA